MQVCTIHRDCVDSLPSIRNLDVHKNNISTYLGSLQPDTKVALHEVLISYELDLFLDTATDDIAYLIQVNESIEEWTSSFIAAFHVIHDFISTLSGSCNLQQLNSPILLLEQNMDKVGDVLYRELFQHNSELDSAKMTCQFCLQILNSACRDNGN